MIMILIMMMIMIMIMIIISAAPLQHSSSQRSQHSTAAAQHSSSSSGRSPALKCRDGDHELPAGPPAAGRPVHPQGFVGME